MRVLSGEREDDARTGTGRANEDGREGSSGGGREERLGRPFVDEVVDFLREGSVSVGVVSMGVAEGGREASRGV